MVAAAAATVSYTRPPPPGKRAGRTVDGELWSKLRPALAVSTFAEHDTLADSDDPHVVEVQDARGLSVPPTLATHGFELRHSPSQVTEWQRAPETVAKVCAEAEEIVRQATGAASAISFDNTWRNSCRSNFDSSLGPGGRASAFSAAVARVHTDFTPDSALAKVEQLRARGLLPPEACDGERFYRAIVNVWRAYGPGDKVRSAPLALIAADSVAASEGFPYALVHGDEAGINGSLAYNGRHRWHYYSEMLRDEVLLFLNFEEQEDASAPRCVYHAALDAARAMDEPPGRLSVEVRVLALFPRGS